MNIVWRLPTALELIVFVVGSLLAGLLLRRTQVAERKTVLRFRELFPLEGARNGRGEPWTKIFADSLPAWLLRGSWTQFGELLLTDATARTRLETRLIQAGYYGPHGANYFSAIKLLAMLTPPAGELVGAMLGCWPLARGLVFSSILGGLGMLAPGLWLDLKKRRRQVKLRNALPDYLDLTTACLDGGVTMDAALQRVSEELAVAHPLLTSELSILRSEIEVGATIDVAFSHFADRTDVDEIRSLATFLQQSQRFGATMSDALRDLSDMLRTQREQRAEELAQKAAVKIIFPTMFCIFPAVFVVLIGPAALQLKNGFGPNAAASSAPSTMTTERPPRTTPRGR